MCVCMCGCAGVCACYRGHDMTKTFQLVGICYVTLGEDDVLSPVLFLKLGFYRLPHIGVDVTKQNLQHTVTDQDMSSSLFQAKQSE